MRGIADEGDRSPGARPPGRPVEQRPFLPAGRHRDEGACLRREAREAGAEFALLAGRAPARLVPVVADDRHDVDLAAGLHRIVDEVGVAPEPERGDGRAKLLGQLRGRHDRAPGGAPGESRQPAVAEARAQRRPQSVGADQRAALLVTQPLRVARLDRDAMLMDREILHPRADPQRDFGILRGRGRERGLEVGAVDHPIGRAIAFRGHFPERDAHDFAAGRLVMMRIDWRDRCGSAARDRRAPASLGGADAGAGFSSRGACSTRPRGIRRASARAAAADPGAGDVMVRELPRSSTVTLRRHSPAHSVGSACRHGAVVAVERGAVGADEFAVAAHVAEHVRWSNGGVAPMRILRADLDHRTQDRYGNADDVVGHCGLGKIFRRTIAWRDPRLRDRCGVRRPDNRKARGRAGLSSRAIAERPQAGGHRNDHRRVLFRFVTRALAFAQPHVHHGERQRRPEQKRHWRLLASAFTGDTATAAEDADAVSTWG